MDAGLLVLVIVIGVGLIQAVVWVLLVRSWRKRSERFLAEFRARADAGSSRPT